MKLATNDPKEPKKWAEKWAEKWVEKWVEIGLKARWRKFLSFAFLFFFMACQSFTSNPGGVSELFAPLDGFRNDLLYGKFVGSNRALLAKNPVDNTTLWNNCLDFIPPATVSLTDFADYEWTSDTFGEANGDAQAVYYPNEIINGVSYITTDYFVLRYDITNAALNNYANWAPITDSPLFQASQFNAAKGEENTLVGKSVFQIVYFQNFKTNATTRLREVDFIFGGYQLFEKTDELPSPGPALRAKYESIADDLVRNGAFLIRAQLALRDQFVITYRETPTDITSGSRHAFEDNPTKTCP